MRKQKHTSTYIESKLVVTHGQGLEGAGGRARQWLIDYKIQVIYKLH